MAGIKTITVGDIQYDINNGVLTFNDVPAASWTADTTYTGYGYKAVLSLAGVTVNHCPIVNLSPADVATGYYAPVATSGAGTVTIYATVNTESITIPSIVCVRTVA